MKINIRSAAALLALLLLATVATACGSNTQTTPTDTEAESETNAETEAVTETVVDWKSAGIEAVDYSLVADVAGFKTMMTGLEAKASTDVSSTFESAVKKAETAMEKIAKNIDALE